MKSDFLMRIVFPFVLVGTLMLAACGDKSSKPTQVAVKVNGTEITVHQVNQVLQRLPGINEQAAARARQEVVQRLIDTELLRQQAVAGKLDRRADVMQTIEASKTEILARAYLQTIAEKEQVPTDDEVAKFYSAKPELFNQRKVFRLTEIVLPGRPLFYEDLVKFLDTAKTPDDVRTWLKTRGVEPASALAVRSSDQFPMETLTAVVKLKERDFVTYMSGQNLAIGYIESATPAPLPEAAAKPLIRSFLLQQKRNESTRKEVERLRAVAKIEKTASSDEAAAKPAEPAASPADSEKAAIERGVKGLK
jgi:EpsD family peptidyl-prolyl cis-trans isomerase